MMGLKLTLTGLLSMACITATGTEARAQAEKHHTNTSAFTLGAGGLFALATTAEPPAPASAATGGEPVQPAATISRFRNGFSLSVGQETGTTAGGADISGQLYGLDWRIGGRVNEAISVYLHSHLSFGTASVGGGSGATGNFATALIGEYAFPMRLFVGAGAGYGVLNNPNGPLTQVRAGYYLSGKKGTGKSRRLNVALDLRWYFVDDAGTGITVTHIALSLGYDAF